MTRVVILAVAAAAILTFGACAGAYVAGDVGPHHRDSSGPGAFGPMEPPDAAAKEVQPRFMRAGL